MVKKCSGLIAAALSEKKAAFYTSLSDASWTAEDRARGWEPIRHHYSSSWNGQMQTLVRRYCHHARVAWGGGATPLFALAMGVASRRRRRRVTRHSTSDGSDETDGSSDRGISTMKIPNKTLHKIPIAEEHATGRLNIQGWMV